MVNFPITITPNFTPPNGNIVWNVPSNFNFTISGNTLTINSGPLMPNVSLPISATLTSPFGNPVTSTVWYTTYSCSGGFELLRSHLSENNIEKTETEKFDDRFKTFPNPVTNEINILSNSQSTVRLIDVNGLTVLSRNITIGYNKIPIGGLSNGFYTLQIIEKGKIYLKKIIVNK